MIIGVIGAGAAGLIATATIREKNPLAKVLLFDSNSRVGRKVAISGGGRCNVTTALQNSKELFQKYPRGSNFLKFPFKVFSPDKVIDWFQSRGVALKIEDNFRVFPQSNNSEEVVELFEKLISDCFYLNQKVTAVKLLSSAESKFQIVTKSQTYLVDKLILTTGGSAYRQTGSTGDGYSFAQQFQHIITQLGPSLNSFLVAEDWAKHLSGIALKDAQLSCQQATVSGDLLFTHFGISGPATFALASHICYQKLPLAVTLRLQSQTVNLNALIQVNGKKTIKNILSQILPDKVSRTTLEQGNINPDKQSASLTKLERSHLTNLLNVGLPLTLTARRAGDEFVTAGGVSLEEVNAKTMESKLQPNLYFAGELLDVDGYTGGFNLQASWATGRLAGLNAAKK